MTGLGDLLADELRNTRTSWSMGSYGAVAEFFHAPGEASDVGDLALVTARGGIRVQPRPDIGICAFDDDGGTGRQQVALCLPAQASRMSARSVLTECGPDASALRNEDRNSVLFDLGVSAIGGGCFQAEFCIRTPDPALIDLCRTHCGTCSFAEDSPLLGALLEAEPHRVVITRLGRIEVFQSIGGAHTGGSTPEGPHTHLLPELLRLNLTHADSVPIKRGWVPCAFLHAGSRVVEEPGIAHR